MDVAKCFLRGISPYSQSRAHFTEKLPKEKSDDYEKRTWRERVHVDEESGFICIPPMAIKNCLSECAKRKCLLTQRNVTPVGVVGAL